MKNVEKFLDWLVELDIRHYKTESTIDYKPSGNSHFYLAGSSERFTSNEMILIWEGDFYKDSYDKFKSKALEIKEAYESGNLLGSQPHIEKMFSNPDLLIILTKDEFIEKLKDDVDFSVEWGNDLYDSWKNALSDHAQYLKRIN